jgi:membrane associated rhomboid family serine protease
MIPLRDNIPSRSYPIVNLLLIWVTCAVFVVEIAQGPRLQEFLQTWGMTPARLQAEGLRWATLVTFVTSIFLHGGWAHLLGNMWFLYIFGDNVEDYLGHGRYLLFYLLGGVLSGLTQFLFSIGSPVPAIGASGAIAAVLGAYFVLFPLARVVTLVWFFWFLELVELPAVMFLGLWFIFQFFSGLASLPFGVRYVGGVAWWAHVGGFVTGFLIARAVRGARRQYRLPPPYRLTW